MECIKLQPSLKFNVESVLSFDSIHTSEQKELLFAITDTHYGFCQANLTSEKGIFNSSIQIN